MAITQPRCKIFSTSSSRQVRISVRQDSLIRNPPIVFASREARISLAVTPASVRFSLAPYLSPSQSSAQGYKGALKKVSRR